MQNSEVFGFFQMVIKVVYECASVKKR